MARDPNVQARKKSSLRHWAWLGACLVWAGCGDDDGVSDAGRDAAPFDATVVVDSEFVPDAPMPDAPSDASVAMDASGFDAAMQCGGDCRPDEGFCGGVGRCVLWGATPMCTNEAGRLQAGSPCESPQQCADGLTCFRRAEGGVCGPVCCPGADTCGDETACTGIGVLVDGTVTEYGECRPPRECALLTGATCEEGEACYVIRDRASFCRPAGTATAGEGCVMPNDCAPGFSCVGAFEGTCVRNCRLGSDGTDACPSEEGQCRAYPDSPDGTGLCSS